MANMYEHPLLSYGLGFKIGNTTIPDPSAFSGSESDVDTLGERDANGYLHRNKVATKHPMSLEYTNIPWNAIVQLCQLMTSDKFQFTFPDPFGQNATRQIDAYAGNRQFTAVKMTGTKGEYLGTIKVNIIEY